MKVFEIFKSLQGESTFQGLPCVFVRLTGCNLRCEWCDTKYAYKGGKEMTILQIMEVIKSYKTPLVEITGGEPLLQEEVYELSTKLLDKGYRLLIETNGSLLINRIPRKAIKIIDIKCPASGMRGKICWQNLKKLNHKDEIKFVISDYEDYKWAKSIVKKYDLLKYIVLFSPVFEKNKKLISSLSEWLLKDNLNVRLQIQLHKYIGVK
ncbi:MAG: radical SAM protein [bacterium]|nr:radical SAM protein [bacterium]